MKRILLSIIIFCGMHAAFSQDNPFYNPSIISTHNPMYSPGGFNSFTPSSVQSEQKKMDVGVQLGTSFSTDFNKGFAFTTMVAPELRYRVNKRLSIRGGISIANSEYGNTLVYSPYEGAGRYSGNITQGIIYVSGDYVISPKLILTGTAYKEFSIDYNNPNNPGNMFSPGYDGKGMMMNLRFMPSENTSIEAGIELYQGNNPYRGGLYNPYRPFSPRW